MGVSAEESRADQHQKVLFQFRYQIQRYLVLGYGGGGLVYLAVDGHKGNKRRQVAIKVVRYNNPLGEGEWRYWSRLHHPNIVHLLAKFEVSGDRFYVMEYAANGTLFEWMRRHRTEAGLPRASFRVTETRTRRWMRQVLEAGRYCHHLGLYHFDIKSSNILLDGSLNIKLADFGTMKCKEEEEIRHNGCRFYRPPEALRSSGRVRGIAALEAVDVWAIGATMLRFLSGGKLISYRDFTDSDSERKSDILTNIRRNVIRIPTLPIAHEGARPLIIQMLQLEPRRRPSCTSLLKNQWLNHRHSPLSPPGERSNSNLGQDYIATAVPITKRSPVSKPRKSMLVKGIPSAAVRQTIDTSTRVMPYDGLRDSSPPEKPRYQHKQSLGTGTGSSKKTPARSVSAIKINNYAVPVREISKTSTNLRKSKMLSVKKKRSSTRQTLTPSRAGLSPPARLDQALVDVRRKKSRTSQQMRYQSSNRNHRDR
uniref:Protein kinase domain-containing protein n=1 Tax=Strigamia maritima TaxID=126957 RepID=T1JDG2_STRMM